MEERQALCCLGCTHRNHLPFLIRAQISGCGNKSTKLTVHSGVKATCIQSHANKTVNILKIKVDFSQCLLVLLDTIYVNNVRFKGKYRLFLKIILVVEF